MKYTLPILTYAFDALEPFIDTQTKNIQYSKHNQAYVYNVKAALSKYPEVAEIELLELLKDLDKVPADIRGAVRNNGGGHINHTMFWEVMAPNGKKEPTGALLSEIEKTFGTLSSMKEQFATAAKTRFGSGWAWLVVTADNELKIVSTANQDNPVSEGLTPILGLDVWEHAYYLKYQNRRPEYIEQWWNVVNWDVVERNFEAAK